MPVLLIRHAQAGSRKDWVEDDRLRPLSSKGKRQARALAGLLAGWELDRILSSPYVRCVQTVQPLADEKGLKVEATEDLAEGAGKAATKLVRSLSDISVAMCTHGDVIPEVLIDLADEDRLELGWSPRAAKGSVWVLDGKRGKFVKATYLRPPA
jgi:phosphohistidine phosphatase SixA